MKPDCIAEISEHVYWVVEFAMRGRYESAGRHHRRSRQLVMASLGEMHQAAIERMMAWMAHLEIHIVGMIRGIG